MCTSPLGMESNIQAHRIYDGPPHYPLTSPIITSGSIVLASSQVLGKAMECMLAWYDTFATLERTWSTSVLEQNAQSSSLKVGVSSGKNTNCYNFSPFVGIS